MAGRAGRRRWAGGQGISMFSVLLHSRTSNAHVQAVPLAALCLALRVCKACGGMGGEFDDLRMGVGAVFCLNLYTKLIVESGTMVFQLCLPSYMKTTILGGSCGQAAL